MEIVFIDETFDINQTKNYHISIQASLNGYSFSVLDPIRNKYILLKHLPFSKEPGLSEFYDKVATLHKSDEFLNRDYKTVYFSYQSPKYTLIPSALFNKDLLQKFFEFNHVLDEHDQVFFNRLNNTDACNIFVIPDQLVSALQDAFGNVRFFNQVSCLIESRLITYGKKSSDERVIANIYGAFLDILVIRGSEVMLCNTFPWKNEQDIVYFILYVYDQLKLKGEETPLTISGELEKRSKACELLRNYIQYIRFEKRSTRFVYSYTFNDVEPHLFVNLFNLRMCV